jgi:hypothetical protein
MQVMVPVNVKSELVSSERRVWEVGGKRQLMWLFCQAFSIRRHVTKTHIPLATDFSNTLALTTPHQLRLSQTKARKQTRL